MVPSPTSFESFIFSFSFLGRGISVPALQMRESALPQAAPAVCMTRGAVSGRMDFLNFSSCFLYAHLLFCFPLAIFANSSCYSSPFSLPVTFSHPVPLPFTPSPLTPSASFFCPNTGSCVLESHSRYIVPTHDHFVQVSSCAWGTEWALLGLCWGVRS